MKVLPAAGLKLPVRRPCPICSTRPDSQKLSLWLDPDGHFGVHCYGGCKWKDVVAALAAEGVATVSENGRAPGDALRGAIDAWQEAEPIAGSPAEGYLRRREVWVDDVQDLKWSPSRRAMLAKVSRLDGKGKGISQTKFSSADKADRRFFGKISGGVVRLFSPDGDWLAVGEGIESSLAFRVIHDTPTWATLSTSGMRAVELPEEHRRIVIALDFDGPGLTAAEQLLKKLQAEGREVSLCWPSAHGRDFADDAKERKDAI